MNEYEKKIVELIDDNRQEIIEFARDIYTHAELGYKEFRTSGKFIESIRSRVSRLETELAITGVKGYINEEKKDNYSLALIGELDALRIPDQAYANPETQAAHCCGHHAQLAGVVGSLIALSDPEIKKELDGQVVFFAVPAEEYGEIEFKNTLIEQGRIRYGGGKCELIRIGAFDDIDSCVVHHINANGFTLGSGTNNGFVSKVIKLKGKATHAAATPEKGINALSAASLGLQALALNRETFRDQDSVRVHPIMTKGGNLVNVVPDDVVIETLVRGKTIEAFTDADMKVDRSFKAGAMALGAGYRIETMPGYLPQIATAYPQDLVEAIRELKEPIIRPAGFHSGGSTDVGDVQSLMPVLTFNTGGMTGGTHQSDFDIVDEEEAYILTAKVFAISAYRLLRNGAAEAKKLNAGYKPRFADKEEYIQFMEKFNRVEEG